MLLQESGSSSSSLLQESASSGCCKNPVHPVHPAQNLKHSFLLEMHDDEGKVASAFTFLPVPAKTQRVLACRLFDR